MFVPLFFTLLTSIAASIQSDCCDPNIMRIAPGYEMVPLPPLGGCPDSVFFVCSSVPTKRTTAIRINDRIGPIAYGLGWEHSMTWLLCKKGKWISVANDLVVTSISCQ